MLRLRLLFVFLIANLIAAFAVVAEVPTTLNDFVLPGSQPNESGNLENPDKCDNCHGGYDEAVEPAFNWRGSMMAQAARDPLFWASVTIANQDAPESGDLCIRCHSPAGWLEGRSTPTDGSALNNNDREGVQCDFCHKLIRPTALGVNPYPDDSAYTAGTYDADQSYLAGTQMIPAHSANGMYIADSDNAKRGPFVDAQATHQMYYSPFHPEAGICGTCHDVSNPAFSREPDDNYVPNDFDTPAPDFSPYSMFPVERTYSEWLMSAYNTPEGIYAPQFGGNKDTVSTCQDCHMRDTTGYGCNKSAAPERDDLPHHDQTGGNTFIPYLIDFVFPGEADVNALMAGVERAHDMLRKAATLEASATQEGSQFLLEAHIINETGHKLPSGYPEGRRLWINVRAFDASDNLIYESGAYDTVTGVLTHDTDIKIYEIKPGISEELAPVVGLPSGPSFHFVLNDTIFSDNRIPPRGFANAAFDSIQSPPVSCTYADSQYWDDTYYYLPGAAATIEVTLYYQTTSKEYVEFLRDENTTDSSGQVFYDLWATNGRSQPVAMVADTLTVSPIPGNQPPVLAPIGPQEGSEGSQLTFVVTASDPDGPAPSLSPSGLPEGALFVDSGNGIGVFDWTPGYDQAAVYPVTFYATDDSAAVDSEEVQITVHNVNQSPVLAPIGPQEGSEGSQLTFVVTASDPDGPAPSLSPSGLPEGALFADSGNGIGVFDWTPGYHQAAVYPVTFYATDDSAAVDSEEVQITVHNVNRPPVLAPIGPHSVAVDSLLELDLTASDPDGTIPVFTVEDYPSAGILDDHGDGTAIFSWQPEAADTGIHVVLFMADDGELIDSEWVEITVEPESGCCVGLRGNVDDDSGDETNIVDLTYLVAYLFGSGSAPPCFEEGDLNADAEINIVDLTYLVAYLFGSGDPPMPCR